MGYLTAWITNIILFILLATVIDMLLPNSAMQKYAKMVIGLLLIAIMLTPILKLFSSDFEKIISSAIATPQEEKNIEKLMESKKKEIQASQQAYILEQMAVQLKTDVKEELMKKYNMDVKSIDLVVAEVAQPEFPKDIKKIHISLSPTKKEGAVEVVNKIEINTRNPLPDHNDDLKKIKNFLAAKWSIKGDILDVEMERRGS